MTFSSINFLCKIQRREYLESYQHGNLYMKNVLYHRLNEAKYPNSGIGDAEEGLLLKGGRSTLSCNGEVVALLKDFELFTCDKNPIFCTMCSDWKMIDENTLFFKPEERVISDFVFGDQSEYGIILIDRNPFLEKIEKALNAQGLWGCSNCVNYTDSINQYDEKYEPAFRKRIRFSYQHEFRIWIDVETNDSFELDIGDISDISLIFPIEVLQNGITVAFRKEGKIND